MADKIGEALDFMEACGVNPSNVPQLAGHQLLHQPRSAAAALRRGHDAPGF
jgi:3-deoxy-D-arabino-heptulosonate 7-phosphate (DAHP) synthase class II